MQKNVIPTVVSAFFKLDMPVLRHWCKDSALAQMRAVAAAREIEGLSMDGTILNVQKAELAQAKSLEKGVPIVVVTSQVQYIHCVRNKKVRRRHDSRREADACAFVISNNSYVLNTFFVSSWWGCARSVLWNWQVARSC